MGVASAPARWCGALLATTTSIWGLCPVLAWVDASARTTFWVTSSSTARVRRRRRSEDWPRHRLLGQQHSRGRLCHKLLLLPSRVRLCHTDRLVSQLPPKWL